MKQLLLPPSAVILALIAAILILRRRRDVFWWASLTLVLLLYLMATPLGSGLLSRQLETDKPLPTGVLPQGEAQAIVVIGSDQDYAVELSADTVGSQTLARLRYAAQLHRRTKLPILVSGGILSGNATSLAALMKGVLEQEFGVPVEWVENRSRDTWENAANSAAILKEAGMTRVYLVTHAHDMPRAAWSFRKSGLTVIPAPIGFEDVSFKGLRTFVPSVRALTASYYALYELAGGIEYRLRH